MSEDIVNQLTLNFLISKTQRHKLNKKVKENANSLIPDKELYGQRLTQLFNDLLVNKPPEMLSEDVKIGFDFFIGKCINYFKAFDNNDLLEKERSCECSSNNIICDDIEVEIKTLAIENGNYELGEDTEDNEDYNYTDHIDTTIEQHCPVTVKKKYKQHTTSVGVDNIQKLPLDWFQNVRENYKKNKIIPRRKNDGSDL